MSAGRRYLWMVRNYHPMHYDVGWWAGVTKREGNSRVTDICAHRHGTRAEAETCAQYLAELRNGGRPC